MEIPVRNLTKDQRVKAVTWIRSGAPVQRGLELLYELTGKKKVIEYIKSNTGKESQLLETAFCHLLNITIEKFRSVKQQHHEQKSNQKTESPGPSPGREKTTPTHPGRFRKEFPFLSSPDCPPELKILAADKITAWEKYTKAHKSLFDCTTLEECFEKSHELIQAYLENQRIYEELNYFKERGVVLGKHHVFKAEKRKKILSEASIVELVTLATKTLPHRIWRIESEIKKGDKPHLLGERQQRLEEVKADLSTIKKMLNINE